MSNFTKKWRVKHGKPLTYNERIINSACDIIEEQDKRIVDLEKALDKIRLISGRSYKLPVTSVAAMKNLRIINQRCEQALKSRT